MVYTISEISLYFYLQKVYRQPFKSLNIIQGGLHFYNAIKLMEIFNDDSKAFINAFVEEKVSVLRENADFNQKSIRLSDAMDELEKTLSKNQKNLFDEIVKLFYQTEEYYFALSYSLGVKYGNNLHKL